MMETYEQCRRRVCSALRNVIRVKIAARLVSMAREGALPDLWLTARHVNRVLEEKACWNGIPEPLARFLIERGREAIVRQALESLARHFPETWWCDGDRFRAVCVNW